MCDNLLRVDMERGGGTGNKSKSLLLFSSGLGLINCYHGGKEEVGTLGYRMDGRLVRRVWSYFFKSLSPPPSEVNGTDG